MSNGAEPALESHSPVPKSSRRWRVLLPCGTLVVGLLALGAWGYWKQQNADLFRLGETAGWQGDVWEAKSQTWDPLTKDETERLVRQFSRAHEFHPLPNFCATTVYYGSPRYFVKLTAPAGTALVFGVWASGRLADVWPGRIYGPGGRRIQFGGDTDEIASILQIAQERAQGAR